jgi:hypothetical protein
MSLPFRWRREVHDWRPRLDAGAADELYRKALCIAREQEAKLWELRAAVLLARLRRDQGRRAEARDLLAPAMAGSPKASPPATSKTRRRCSTS